MRDVASRFDMSESTVYRVLQRVAQFLMTLGPSVIKFPAEFENLTSSFEKRGLGNYSTQHSPASASSWLFRRPCNYDRDFRVAMHRRTCAEEDDVMYGFRTVHAEQGGF
ncbi:hypothetical protein MRX96_003010 [Rhipicephalus microplus]